MGIMNIFKATPDAPAPNANANANANGGANTDGGKQVLTPDGKPATGADGKMPGSNQEPPNPLDVYAKLFDNATTPEKDLPPAFNLDPKLMDDVSNSLDFTKGVSPELLSKATSGDMNAMLQIINRVGQQSYRTALHHSTSLTDKFVGARSQHDLKNLGTHVKRELTDQALSSDPNFSHPVVKKQLNDIANRMQRENPEASPIQIAQAAKQYILDLAEALNPPSKEKQEGADKEMDWSEYLK